MKEDSKVNKIRIESLGYDFDFELEAGPPDPKNFWGIAIARVLEEGIDGVVDYQIYIGTPMSLPSNFSEVQSHIRAFSEESGKCVFGQGLLLVDEYDIDAIEKAIRDNVDLLEYYAFDVS